MPSTIVKTETKPKEKLFQTAAQLFYQHGYRAIGVDTIAAESGIGKMTLYRHYLTFFESLQNYVKTPACHGCPFINVATEYPETDYPGHQVALAHKQTVRARFRQLAREAGASNPEALADQLFLLMDGAYVAARMFGTKNPASHLASAAKALIDSQIPE
jgi:hypothetical protein